MSKFVVRKRFDLSFLGEGWEDAYMVFTPFSYNDSMELVSFRKKIHKVDANSDESDIKKVGDTVKQLIASKFVEGQGFTGEKLEPITADDLFDLPQEVFERLMVFLNGEGVPPKS